ncbi:UDP-N-acetylglucosamine diphosphorylase [Schizopora paradoxa]|uniref:UDP-N-acetylglucosamine diphosphorylase n=1 Tax=Schizopora paradoxa TaxID=27342 RepID=A0A0H2RCN1_9AGAM|nr:UDP-N-acetylglucosamine diphosphorylase [Schizopora paradoxa]
MSRYETLKAKYSKAGQEHVFAFWEKLSEDERTPLLDQLERIDVERVNVIYKKAIKADEDAKHASSDAIEPLPEDAFESIVGADAKAVEYRKTGLRAIAEGEVAVLLMAGGQGTRLGSSDPKGCYDIGLPSKKSLFQIQAEKIKRLQAVAEKECGKPAGSVVIRWYIMTSDPTHDATRKFFGWGKNGERLDTGKPANFGLSEEQVVFFKQGVLSCLSTDGKILLENPGKVAVAPDGNGGLYPALRQPLKKSINNVDAPSIISDLRTRKIQHIHAYCVDNCLVKVADPVFVGHCIAKQAECGTKVVPKAYATESVGVVARKDGKFAVVEYSEITTEQAEKVDPKTGALAFRAANIVNHFYTTAFLERTREMEHSMAHHIARKKIPSIAIDTGAQGKTDGMKLEMFVFDVFPFTEQFAVLEVAREEEFSPLKNAPGTKADNPETSRRDLLAQQKRFLEKAGAKVKEGVEIELSPLVSYAGEGLESIKNKTFEKSGKAETLEELAAL